MRRGFGTLSGRVDMMVNDRCLDDIGCAASRTMRPWSTEYREEWQGRMDHRKVPLEVLREFARSYAELTSMRHVAEDAGVGRSTVHKFITEGTKPHPRIRRLLALWYLRRVSGIDEFELIRPYVSALETLIRDVPDPSRTRAMLAVLDNVERACAEAGEETPRWVTVLRAQLSQDS